MKDSPVDNLIGIHGAPRSGTSWLGQLFNSSDQVAYRYQPFFSHAFRGRIDEHSDSRDVGRFMLDLLASEDAFVLQTGEGNIAARELRFKKSDSTHLVYKEVRFHHLLPVLLEALPNARFIGIIRDPRAVLASWFLAPREFLAGWSPSQEWRNAKRKNNGLDENWYGFERWRELAHLFLDLEQECPGRFRVVRYEHLVSKPLDTMRSLFAFGGLPMCAQTEHFIQASTTSDDGDPYGVHRRRDQMRDEIRLPAGADQAIRSELEDTRLSAFLDDNLRPNALRELNR